MIHRQTTVMKFDEFYEKTSFVDLPYFVSRQEENGEVVWFDLETNWKFFNGKWHILIKSEWIECEKPKYELLYEAELNVA